MSMTPVTDHYERAYAHLIEQYKNLPRFAALLASYVRQIQDFEDAAWDVRTARFFDNADLVRLKVLGKIVGQVYRGEDLATYKRFVQARIAINRSNGWSSDIIAVAVLILDGIDLTYEEYYPAAIVLTANTSVAGLDVRYIVELLRETKAAGVGFAFIYQTFADAFAFSATSSQVLDTTHGFSNTIAPTTGGQLVNVA